MPSPSTQGRFHLDNGRIASAIILVLSIAVFFAPFAFASDETDWVILKVHQGNSVLQYHAFPGTAVKLLFPKDEALIEENTGPPKWELSASPLLQKIQVLRLSDIEGRFKVSAAVYDEQLFIFDRLFCRRNASAMEKLLRASNYSPQTAAEALDLARLFLSLSYFELQDPAQFIAFRGDDGKQKNGLPKPKAFSDIIGVSHSPLVTHPGTEYLVDLYTRNQPGVPVSKVSRWQIKIGNLNLEELMSARQEEFAKEHTKNNARSETGVQFSLAIMANGFTNDGATTDMQTWEASDGPGVQRIHYYYQSHEKAEARMNDSLKNAVAIIDNSPWTNSKHTVLIRVNQEVKTLFASELLQEETSVLEYSCTCLQNLLATKQH